jgi:hypothetical protein
MRPVIAAVAVNQRWDEQGYRRPGGSVPRTIRIGSVPFTIRYPSLSAKSAKDGMRNFKNAPRVAVPEFHPGRIGERPVRH